MFFVDQEMAHDCMVFVLKLEEDVGEGPIVSVDYMTVIGKETAKEKGLKTPMTLK